MRIGLLRMKYKQSGGAERSLDMLARGLAGRGHEVRVVTNTWQGEPPQGLEVRELKLKLGNGHKGLDRFAREGVRAMREWGPDTFLSLERIPGAPVLRAGDGCHQAYLQRRSPHVRLPRRLAWPCMNKHKTFRKLERRALASEELSRVIAVSRMVAEELQRVHRLEPERIRVIYNGVDEAWLAEAHHPEVREQARRELGLEPGRPALLFLGGGFERKGLKYAIDALAHLPGVRLLVAGGDKNLLYRLRARVRGVGPRVVFLGNRRDVPRLLAACDAMVLPTIYDPCANACLEAMYAQRPVVTTTANGAAELVEEGVSGVVVDRPQDAPSLAEACRRALELPRPFAHPVYGLDRYIAQVTEVLEQAAAEGRRP
jgi:UDP-glucose:(heptosyl)LPS alpha-1,3-glucosyltransferase